MRETPRRFSVLHSTVLLVAIVIGATPGRAAESSACRELEINLV